MYTDGVDVVIAENPGDATKVWEETGEDRAADYGYAEWRQMPDDESVTLWIEAGDQENFEKAGLPEGATIVENQESEWGFPIGIVALAKNWIKKDGRGFWGSSEF